VRVARALYSAFDEDRETVDCFFYFQLIKDDPRKTQNPVVDRRELGQVAQSESQNPFICRFELLGKKRPCPGAVLMYRSTQLAAVRCSSVGA